MRSEHSNQSKDIAQYNTLVAEGSLPRAYRAILAQLTACKSAWEQAHPNDSVGALYQGYLDMSFIAVAPSSLAERRLKVSLVYLHDTGRFSLWLAAGNRKIQAELSQELSKKNLGSYTLCTLKPGVDAIIAYDVPSPYAFDEPVELTQTLIRETEKFLSDMLTLVQ